MQGDELTMQNPIPVLAHAIAAFQADLAAADGPHYRGAGYPDERLAALLARVVAHLATESRNDSEIVYQLLETTALDDFIETLESASDAVLDPVPDATVPVPGDTCNDEAVRDEIGQQDTRPNDCNDV